MKWKEQLINFSKQIISKQNTPQTSNFQNGIHLAVFSEPFLSLIFEGKKTIESRFSMNKGGPYKKVREGDIIYIKKSGGPVCGYFMAGKVKFFLNDDKSISTVKSEYSKEICASSEKGFWENRKESNFITLIEIKKLRKINPLQIEKRDRTAWVVLRNSDLNNTIEFGNT